MQKLIIIYIFNRFNELKEVSKSWLKFYRNGYVHKEIMDKEIVEEAYANSFILMGLLILVLY